MALPSFIMVHNTQTSLICMGRVIWCIQTGTLAEWKKPYSHWGKLYVKLCKIGFTPEEISSNGGPPFNFQEYNSVHKDWGTRKYTSSAHYSQSNG